MVGTQFGRVADSGAAKFRGRLAWTAAAYSSRRNSCRFRLFCLVAMRYLNGAEYAVYGRFTDRAIEPNARFLP